MHPDVQVESTIKDPAVRRSARSLAQRLTLPNRDLWIGKKRKLTIDGNDLVGSVPHIDPTMFENDDCWDEAVCDISACRSQSVLDGAARAVRKACAEDSEWPHVDVWLEKHDLEKDRSGTVLAMMPGMKTVVGFLQFKRSLYVADGWNQPVPHVSYRMEPEIIYVSPEARSRMIGAALSKAVQWQTRIDLDHIAACLRDFGRNVSLEPRIGGDVYSDGGQRLMNTVEETMNDWRGFWIENNQGSLIRVEEANPCYSV